MTRETAIIGTVESTGADLVPLPSAPLPAAPLPEAVRDTVAAYIADCAGHLKPGSIQRRLNAIAEAHKAAGLDSPTHAAIVRNTLKGIRRTLGTAPAQKAPTLTDDVRALVAATDAGLIGARDRAIERSVTTAALPPVASER